MPKRLVFLFVLHWILVVAVTAAAAVFGRIDWPWLVLGLAVYLAFFALVIVRVVRHLYRFPIPDFMTTFIDNPMRRRIQNPQVIAERMRLAPGMTVVEIGPGNGSYTKAVAEAIHPGGTLYAVDISERVIGRLKERFAREGVANVVPRVEDAYAFTFADGSVDRVFAVTCLPEIPDPVRALAECRRILKPDGLICLSELFLDPDYPLRGTEKRWAEAAGLNVKEEFGNWICYQLNVGK